MKEKNNVSKLIMTSQSLFETCPPVDEKPLTVSISFSKILELSC